MPKVGIFSNNCDKITLQWTQNGTKYSAISNYVYANGCTIIAEKYTFKFLI